MSINAQRRKANPDLHEDAGAVQVVLMDHLRPAFERWLASRGLALTGPIPGMDPDHLPTWVIGPAASYGSGGAIHGGETVYPALPGDDVLRHQ